MELREGKVCDCVTKVIHLLEILIILKLNSIYSYGRFNFLLAGRISKQYPDWLSSLSLCFMFTATRVRKFQVSSTKVSKLHLVLTVNRSLYMTKP